MLYPIAIECGDNDHAFGVIVPDIAGCFSAGDTLDEAMNNAREAVELHLECMASDGESIPQASQVSAYVNDPEYAGYIWAVVEVDISRLLGKAIKINVTLPDVLLRRIDAFVSHNPEYGGNRSAFLATAATEQLMRRGSL